MMRNKGPSLLIPVLFLAMLVLVGSALGQNADSFFSLRFRADAQDLTLTPWYSEEEDCYYLFLPSFVSPSQLTVTHPWYTRMDSGSADTGDLPLDQDIPFQISFLWERPRTYTLRLLPCSAEQTICIDAQDGLLSYLGADKQHAQNAFVTFWDGSGQREYAGKTTMSGRGNSTWEHWEKKPYNLNFSQSVTVGPFDQADQLCLLAEYVDSSKLRNALAYHMAQELDFPYSSPYVYADLFVNGEYLGLYGVATKSEYKKHLEEDGIQAVFELTFLEKENTFHTDGGKGLRIYCGDQSLIQYHAEGMEQALENRDPEALAQHIDLESWAEKYALDELLYNYDLSKASEYYYLDDGDRIRCMLPWDYEWTLYPRLSSNQMSTEYALCGYYYFSNWSGSLKESEPMGDVVFPVSDGAYAEYKVASWYGSLLQIEPFREAVLQTYENVYTDAFFDEITGYLEACRQEIRDSRRSDLVRWSGAYLRSHGAVPWESAYFARPQALAEDLTGRLDYLKALFSNWEDYCLVNFWADISGDISPFKLQLLIPKGDFTVYHELIANSVYAPDGYTMEGVYAQDGTPLESILTVTEDTPLFIRLCPISPGS